MGVLVVRPTNTSDTITKKKFVIMGVKKTKKGTKKFTKEEKLAILKEAHETSVKATLEKYALYPATFYYW